MDKKALILVVDDNTECSALVMSTLEAHDFRMISATGGREAVEFDIQFQPRLVLMDLRMPGVNGFQATQAIHAHRRGRKIPVIAVSGDCVDNGCVSKAFKTGFMACLGKPYDEKALLQTVAEVLACGVSRTRAFTAPEKTRQTSVLR